MLPGMTPRPYHTSTLLPHAPTPCRRHATLSPCHYPCHMPPHPATTPATCPHNLPHVLRSYHMSPFLPHVPVYAIGLTPYYIHRPLPQAPIPCHMPPYPATCPQPLPLSPDTCPNSLSISALEDMIFFKFSKI